MPNTFANHSLADTPDFVNTTKDEIQEERTHKLTTH